MSLSPSPGPGMPRPPHPRGAQHPPARTISSPLCVPSLQPPFSWQRNNRLRNNACQPRAPSRNPASRRDLGVLGCDSGRRGSRRHCPSPGEAPGWVPIASGLFKAGKETLAPSKRTQGCPTSPPALLLPQKRHASVLFLPAKGHAGAFFSPQKEHASGLFLPQKGRGGARAAAARGWQ